MKRTILLALGVMLVLAAISAGSTGCVRRVARPMEDRATESSQTVALDGARDIDLNVEMGAGQLSITSADSSANAVTGRFEFAPANFKPAFSASTKGSTRHVRIDQPKMDFEFGASNIKNQWDLAVAPGIPAMLAITLGAGKADLDMREIDLTGLSVQQGAGDLSLDLRGQRRELAVMATLGAGSATFRVPKDVAVVYDDRKSGVGDFRAEGFIQRPDGTWVNDAWAASYGEYSSGPRTGPVIRLNITRGVGDVRILTED